MLQNHFFQLFNEVASYPVFIKNNAGVFIITSLFWTILAHATGQEPEGHLLKAINETFGSIEKFKTVFQ